MRKVDTTLRDRLSSLVNAMGYEFVGAELMLGGRESLLRIYIDKEDGVTLTDCSKVSHQISAMLDVDDPIQGAYNLEVSSPGVNRPLFEPAHFKKNMGSRVKIRLNQAIFDQRNFVGILVRAEEHDIHLQTEEKEVVIPFSSIDKANVLADF